MIRKECEREYREKAMRAGWGKLNRAKKYLTNINEKKKVAEAFDV